MYLKSLLLRTYTANSSTGRSSLCWKWLCNTKIKKGGTNIKKSVKGCTHRARILCDGTVDSHRKEKKAIAQWEHLSFAIFAIFDLKKQLKLLAMAFNQFLTCLIVPLRWACFPIKTSRNAQWVHLFSVIFRLFTLFFSLKVHFRW